jgi:hypothetical protein
MLLQRHYKNNTANYCSANGGGTTATDNNTAHTGRQLASSSSPTLLLWTQAFSTTDCRTTKQGGKQANQPCRIVARTMPWWGQDYCHIQKHTHTTRQMQKQTVQQKHGSAEDTAKYQGLPALGLHLRY